MSPLAFPVLPQRRPKPVPPVSPSSQRVAPALSAAPAFTFDTADPTAPLPASHTYLPSSNPSHQALAPPVLAAPNGRARGGFDLWTDSTPADLARQAPVAVVRPARALVALAHAARLGRPVTASRVPDPALSGFVWPNAHPHLSPFAYSAAVSTQRPSPAADTVALAIIAVNRLRATARGEPGETDGKTGERAVVVSTRLTEPRPKPTLQQRNALQQARNMAAASREVVFLGRVFADSIIVNYGWSADTNPHVRLPAHFFRTPAAAHSIVPRWLARLAWNPATDDFKTAREPVVARRRQAEPLATTPL
ncbi:hypothetical protein Q5752_003720 [Cryptotrichosporon argae]